MLPSSGPDLVLPAPRLDLCLDFANTRYWRGRAMPTETLTGPEELAAWCRDTGDAPLPLLAAADERGREAAIVLRETIYGLFHAVAAGAPPGADSIARLNAALAQAPPRRVLVRSPENSGWRLPHGETSILALLAPVLWSAGDLLASPRAARVRLCQNPACGWLFLDDSKAGNRRWCSMSACGNRAKAHRHYLRNRPA